MKKIYLLLFAFALFGAYTKLSAQCTSMSQSGVYPDTLAYGCINQSYIDTVTAVFPSDTLISGFNLLVDSVYITGITNLPAGLSSDCIGGQCVSYGNGNTNPFICIQIFGVPTESVDTIKIMIHYTGYTTFFGSAQSYNDSTFAYLTIEQIDTTVTQDSDSLLSNEFGGTYQWIDCSDSSAINGATNQSYTPSANGSYAVIVNKNGCSDTSECVAVMSLGVSKMNSNNRLAVYPNPTKGVFNVELKSKNETIKACKVINALGQSFNVLPSELGNSNKLNIDLSSYPKGVYIVHLTTTSGVLTQRLVLE